MASRALWAQVHSDNKPTVADLVLRHSDDVLVELFALLIAERREELCIKNGRLKGSFKLALRLLGLELPRDVDATELTATLVERGLLTKEKIGKTERYRVHLPQGIYAELQRLQTPPAGSPVEEPEEPPVTGNDLQARAVAALDRRDRAATKDGECRRFVRELLRKYTAEELTAFLKINDAMFANFGDDRTHILALLRGLLEEARQPQL